MEVFIIFLSMLALIWISYRGLSIILFAPLVAVGTILLSQPHYVLPLMDVFLEQMVRFIKHYYLTFLLGAVFGKVIELSGSAQVISRLIMQRLGANRAILATVLIGAILTYGGVSAFVVVFALYPFAVQLFRAADIPKRLMPAALVLGGFGFSTSALPGVPQIQNMIPTSYFHTDTWAAPVLGMAGALFVFGLGILYLERQKRQAKKRGEGYGSGILADAPAASGDGPLPHPLLAVLPLVLVGVLNKLFADLIKSRFGPSFDFHTIGLDLPPISVTAEAAIWSVEMALAIGIAVTILSNFRRIKSLLAKGMNEAVSGTVSATVATATQFGYGGIIQTLPGFVTIQLAIARHFANPLWNETIMGNLFAGITGSASGGLSIALEASGQNYLQQAAALGIDPQVLHRVAALAGAGLDTLPHNGAILTILAITGMTHRQAYREILGLTLIKVAAPFFVILLYSLFGIV